MNCIKCKGTGTESKRQRKGGRLRVLQAECNDCKGTGLCVKMNNQVVEIYGLFLLCGYKITYTNTAGRKAECKISAYYVSPHFLNNKDQYPPHWYPLKDIWFEGVDTVTGAAVHRPLWSSITLKKKHELFETNKVARI